MQTVKVERGGITRDQAITALGKALGADYQLTPDGDGLQIRKGTFARASVEFHSEPDGTTFDVKPEGITAPILWWGLKLVNDRGIVRHVADTLRQPDTFPAET